jgi:hypothetical protein
MTNNLIKCNKSGISALCLRCNHSTKHYSVDYSDSESLCTSWDDCIIEKETIRVRCQRVSANKKKNSKAAEFLDNLTEFLGNAEGQNSKDIRKELIEEGIDVDGIINKVKKIVQAKYVGK